MRIARGKPLLDPSATEFIPLSARNDQIARRLVCKLTYANSVRPDDAVVSTRGISLDGLPDWAKDAVEQLPSGEFVQSPGFHTAIQKLHSADPVKVADAQINVSTVRFNIDGMIDVSGFQTPAGLIVAANFPLLPLRVYHPLGDKDTLRGYVDIPIGSCIETCGLYKAMASLDDDRAYIQSDGGRLCSEWCDSSCEGGVPTCGDGIDCPFIHADVDAIRRCCASCPCDKLHRNGELKYCPYYHNSADYIPCMWWYLPCFATPSSLSSHHIINRNVIRPSDTLGGLAAARGDRSVGICKFKEVCKYGLRCKSIHPIMERLPPMVATNAATSVCRQKGRTLLENAIEDQLRPPQLSSFESAGWALPHPLKKSMLINASSWKRRYYGLYLEALSKSDDKLWQPLGHTTTTVPPPRGCVWYCPSVLIGQGSSSKVYLGVDNLGRPVAVKLYDATACESIASRGEIDGDFSEARELALQSETHGGLVSYITHVHWVVVDSHDPMVQVDRYALVTELMNFSLETLIKKWKEVKCTTEELADVVPSIALKLISTIRDFQTVPDSNGDVMLLNDLNLKNIMIDCRGNVRVIGVGISRRVDANENTQHRDRILTSWLADDDGSHRAPEMQKVLDVAQHNDESPQQRLPSDFKADVYSLGSVLGQLGQVTDTPTTHFQCCLADFVHRCTRESPSGRPTCDELLYHPLLWSAEECIIFLAQFVNPFLPTNATDYESNEFRKLSQKFLGTRNYKDWKNVMEQSTNSDLKTFWEELKALTKQRDDFKGKRAKQKVVNGDQTAQFHLLREINNHVHYHHEPFVPEAALLEAFPYLVMDAYSIALANGQEFGAGHREFLKPKISSKAVNE